jgi:hypothetical protein
MHTELCDESCECSCDSCVEQFEKNWAILTTEKKLCSHCGIPNTMTMDSLQETRYIHFYQPCESCKPLYLELVKSEGLCHQCQGRLIDSKCPGCFCTENMETCECRQCILARKNADTS